VRDSAAARDGQPPEIHRKNQNEHRAEREIRHGEAEERENANGISWAAMNRTRLAYAFSTKAIA